MSDIPSEILLPVPISNNERDSYKAINDIIRKIADAINDNVFLPSSGSYYFGDLDTDGSWRIILSGSNLVHQRLESGTWTTKHSITP